MARTTRLLNPDTKPVRREPTNPSEWDKLLRRAISRAELLGDRRLEGLKAALTGGKSALILKKMGIICEADLLREFPDRST